MENTITTAHPNQGIAALYRHPQWLVTLPAREQYFWRKELFCDDSIWLDEITAGGWLASTN